MKVILLKDVARIGRKHEVKDVPDGHAQNFLIPRKLAERATPRSIERLEAQGAHISAEREAEEERFKAFLASMKDEVVELTAPANEQGHLFKGIHAAEIAEALTARAGMNIAETSIILAQSIKEIGVHEVTVSHSGNNGTINLSVVAA